MIKPEQDAIEAATEVVRAQSQMFYDLLADPGLSLDGLKAYVTQPQLGIDLRNLQKKIAAGNVAVHSTGPVTIEAVSATEVRLKDDPPTVVLRVCVDTSRVSGSTDGRSWSGGRHEMSYHVVKTDYLPAPGWALANVQPPAGYDGSRPC